MPGRNVKATAPVDEGSLRSQPKGLVDFRTNDRVLSQVWKGIGDDGVTAVPSIVGVGMGAAVSDSISTQPELLPTDTQPHHCTPSHFSPPPSIAWATTVTPGFNVKLTAAVGDGFLRSQANGLVDLRTKAIVLSQV